MRPLIAKETGLAKKTKAALISIIKEQRKDITSQNALFDKRCKEKMRLLNKYDELKKRYVDAVFVSKKEGGDMEDLKKRLKSIEDELLRYKHAYIDNMELTIRLYERMK